MNGNIHKEIIEDFQIHISSKKMLEICIEIAKAFVYLHSLRQPILHRDLKVENILINSYNQIKICDFGISKSI